MSRWIQRVSSWYIVQLCSQKSEVGEAHFPGLHRQKQASDSDFCLMEYGEKDHWIRIMHLDATVHGYYNDYAISFHPRIKTQCRIGSSQGSIQKGGLNPLFQAFSSAFEPTSIFQEVSTHIFHWLDFSLFP